MKTNTIAVILGASLLPLSAFAQTPPAAPAPPAPPAPPAAPAAPAPPAHPGMFHDRDHDRGPKTPVTWLGVETSGVPRVVSEQLGLPRGFGLVVDYVVPDGPAAAAGVQQNDILKMLNDQILLEPDQLAKLVRSYAEGTSVTLTVLRKGAEQKLTVKLAKHDVSMHTGMLGPDFGDNVARQFGKHWMDGQDFSQMGVNMDRMKEELRENLGHLDMDSIRNTVREARRAAARASQDARRQARELRVMTKDGSALKSTRIDVGKAQIVYSDAQGEMKLENLSGKKMLTAKDAQGKLLFSGPVETKEDVDKLPPEVRQRYEKLEKSDLPSVQSGSSTLNFNAKSDDNDNDADDDDNDNDNDDDNNDEAVRASMQQVSLTGFPGRPWLIQSLSI